MKGLYLVTPLLNLVALAVVGWLAATLSSAKSKDDGNLTAFGVTPYAVAGMGVGK